MTTPYRVALVVFPGIRAFDVAVVSEVWSARHLRGVPPFELRRAAAGPDPIPMSGGLTLTPDRTLDGLAEADLVVVPGLESPDDGAPEPVLEALRTAHRAGTPVAALCAGAFVLAQAGLLDGRRAVTHWHLAAELGARHPAVTVEPEALFVADGNIWTSAGTAAGIDLCLHLVRVAHGAEAAATVARSMVTAPFRTGTQAQFIERPTARTDRDADALAAVRERALQHLDSPLTVHRLAGWAGMSSRSFARRFRAATGSTPLQWLHAQRLAAAQKLLEQTDLAMPEIARRTGFGSEVTMRQHFARHLATSPSNYRSAFNRSGFARSGIHLSGDNPSGANSSGSALSGFERPEPSRSAEHGRTGDTRQTGGSSPTAS